MDQLRDPEPILVSHTTSWQIVPNMLQLKQNSDIKGGLKKNISCTNQMQWSVLSNQVRRRRIPGRRTTNSSFASLQQKSMSSLMPCRQDRSNFTCSKLQKISHPISKSLMVSCSMEKYVWWLTDHYKHGTLRFARACDGIDALQFLPAYICSFSKNFNSSVEEFLLCVLQEFWNCSLVKQNCV